jgi:acetyl esterase/lipase
MIYKTILASLSALLLSACSNAATFVANAPTYFDGMERHANIPFGDHGLKLDIYTPPTTSENTTHPVIIFIHGGRWSDGSKDIYKFVGSRFAKAGYITVIPDYRHYPDVKFPAFVHDNADAVVWTAENIVQYGGNPQNLFVIGHSAGALNAALLVSDETYLPEDIKINAFVGLAGPYDFVPDEEDLKDMFGPPENYPQMQVTTFIDGREPPMLLMHGLKDETVKMSNIHKLSPVLEAHNVPYEIRTYPELNHVDMVTSFVWAYVDRRTVYPDILEFLRAHRQE